MCSVITKYVVWKHCILDWMTAGQIQPEMRPQNVFDCIVYLNKVQPRQFYTFGTVSSLWRVALPYYSSWIANACSRSRPTFLIKHWGKPCITSVDVVCAKDLILIKSTCVSLVFRLSLSTTYSSGMEKHCLILNNFHLYTKLISDII